MMWHMPISDMWAMENKEQKESQPLQALKLISTLTAMYKIN